MRDLQHSFGGFARHCIESFVDKRGDWSAAHNSLWLFSRGVSDLGMEGWGNLQNFKSIHTSKKRESVRLPFPPFSDRFPPKCSHLEDNSSGGFLLPFELGNVCVG